MKPLNPFLIEGYYSPEYFCDREQETSQMKQALFNGRNLTLIAPRRMGKSGLIKNVFYQLSHEKPEAFNMILESYSPGCVRLLKAIAKEGCVSEINSADFLSKYALRATSSVNTSLRTLMQNEHVYRSSEGYIIYNHFFSLWLKRR